MSFDCFFLPPHVLHTFFALFFWRIIIGVLLLHPEMPIEGQKLTCFPVDFRWLQGLELGRILLFHLFGLLLIHFLQDRAIEGLFVVGVDPMVPAHMFVFEGYFSISLHSGDFFILVLDFLGLALEKCFFILALQIQEHERVQDEKSLYQKIEWRVSAKAGRVVDLYDPRFHVGINQNVKA